MCARIILCFVEKRVGYIDEFGCFSEVSFITKPNMEAKCPMTFSVEPISLSKFKFNLFIKKHNIKSLILVLEKTDFYQLKRYSDLISS